MPKIRIETPGAPTPRPVLSQAVRIGNVLQVSGQGPQDPATGEYVHEGDVAAQTARTLANVGAILEAAGSSYDDVIMLRVYLRSQTDFAAMNAAYAAFLTPLLPSGIMPARTTVGAELPHPAMLVEIDALAVLG